MLKKSLAFLTLLVIFSTVGCNNTKSSDKTAIPGLSPSGPKVTEYENNPVIKYGDALDGILWNDPSVIKEGAKYRMWLSAGKPFDVPIVVKTHEASSDDGIVWNINPEPVLEPGQKGSWDDLRIETPSVIKVDATYHLYYGGCNSPCNQGVYNIGHATSVNGTDWEKDPANPVITRYDDPLKWGFYTAAEPAIVYHKGTYYLYYTAAKSNYPEPGAPFGILLATSKDGTNFQAWLSRWPPVPRRMSATGPTPRAVYSTTTAPRCSAGRSRLQPAPKATARLCWRGWPRPSPPIPSRSRARSSTRPEFSSAGSHR